MSKIEQICVSLVVLVCAGLYYPVLSGLPIWDDIPAWFYDSSLNLSYEEIFDSYTWPMSVAFQKFLFSLWGHKYNIYHAVSIGLHLINSILLYNVLSDLKIKGRIAVGLLFLFHPANVITISWMIQLKTLLSFFFAIVSVRLLVLYHKNPVAKGSAGISFLVSVLSKSSSIFLPALLILNARKWEKKTFIILGLSLLIAVTGVARILISGDVHEFGFSLEPFRIDVMLRTMTYYFWQAFLPFNTVPVKDLDLSSGVWFDILTVGLVLFLLYHYRNIFAGKVLLTAQIFLLPFYGIIPAPYMNHTLVGDHHLYLVLPLYLIFLANVPIPREAFRVLFIVLILPFYALKIHRSLPYYQNDVTFYRSIMDEYPESLSMGMNLAFFYLSHGEVEKAVSLVEDMDRVVQNKPGIRKHRYYPEFLIFRDAVRSGSANSKNKIDEMLRLRRGK